MQYAFQRLVPALLLAVSLSWVITSALAQEGAEDASDSNKSPSVIFQEKLDQWKSLLMEMREIQPRYTSVNEAEAAEMRRRWYELIAQGEALIFELQDAGILAYSASGGVDRDIEQFLVKVLHDDMKFNRYELARRVSQVLLDFGCGVADLPNIAGVSAFATNDFEKAGQYLRRAAQNGVLSNQGEKFLSLLPEYKQLWEEEMKLREQAAAETDPEKQLPQVRIETEHGDMVIELFENEAPNTVGNFISLVEKAFYDGLVFHRVLPNFMAQAGCPLGDGTGGPGYSIACECQQPNHRKHFRGSLSMAHSGLDTGGSQFFLTFVPTDHLNGKHTVFGRVIEGMELLGQIQQIEPGDAKKQPDKIIKMEVIRKRPSTEYAPKKTQ